MFWSIFVSFINFKGIQGFCQKFQAISRVQGAKINSRLFKDFKELWEPWLNGTEGMCVANIIFSSNIILLFTIIDISFIRKCWYLLKGTHLMLMRTRSIVWAVAQVDTLHPMPSPGGSHSGHSIWPETHNPTSVCITLINILTSFTSYWLYLPTFKLKIGFCLSHCIILWSG